MSEVTVNTTHRFFIFRHGLATRNPDGYGDQILTATLLDDGIPAIKKLAEYFKGIPSDFQYSSELLRCRQTAGMVTDATGKQFSSDARLDEYHQETFLQLTERVDDLLEDIVLRADRICQNRDCNTQPATILICTHGAVISCLKHLLLEGSHFQKDELDYTLPGEVLEIWKKSVQLHVFN